MSLLSVVDLVEKLLVALHAVVEFLFGDLARVVDLGFGVLGFVIAAEDFVHVHDAHFEVGLRGGNTGEAQRPTTSARERRSG